MKSETVARKLRSKIQVITVHEGVMKAEMVATKLHPKIQIVTVHKRLSIMLGYKYPKFIHVNALQSINQRTQCSSNIFIFTFP